MSTGFDGLTPLIGDLHNHCGISYGHGSLANALANAAERLDFVSVTGHASWPDMPAPDDNNRHMVAFHTEGFARLAKQWPDVVEETRAFAAASRTVPFLGFEMHSRADGDLTIVYRDLDGKLLEAAGVPDMQDRIRALNEPEPIALAFPHHIGYRRGHRGINWEAFAPDVSPVVEIASMHGCTEENGASRPFLHTMGPADGHGTMAYGLASGHRFGVVGSTDHHSGHPGSYGHGLTGVWATGRDRQAIWDAIWARRCWAMTGDRIDLAFAVDGTLMGGTTTSAATHRMSVDVSAGSPIDCVDIIRDGRLVHRRSYDQIPECQATDPMVTRITMEVGWGPRNKRYPWDISLGLSDGRILAVEPRFRGREIVSPVDSTSPEDESNYESRVTEVGDRTVKFETATYGNPTNTTSGTQAMSLLVEAPRDATVEAMCNGRAFSIPLPRLRAGDVAEPMADMPATSVLFHRAPAITECDWSVDWQDDAAGNPGFYYARIRLRNGHMAWSSPVFCDR